VEIYTIGFTQTTAEHFFGRLKAAGIRRLLDVRLNNSSQLAGFAKAKDLPDLHRRDRPSGKSAHPPDNRAFKSAHA
jgi:uncharacterized protein (DUF488 family)